MAQLLEREIEARPQLYRLPEILDRAVWLPGADKESSKQRARVRQQWLELTRKTELPFSFLETPSVEKKNSKDQMCRRIIRVERDRLPELAFGLRMIPLPHKQDMRQRSMRLSERAVESKSLHRSSLRLRHLDSRDTLAELSRTRARVGDARVRASERRIQLNRFLEMLERTRESGRTLTVEKEATPEIKVVRFRVRRTTVSGSCATRLPNKLHTKRIDDSARDLVLNLEYITQLAIEIVRPHLIAVIGVHQLRRDTKVLSRTPYTSLEDGIDAERVAYRPHIELATLERKHR